MRTRVVVAALAVTLSLAGCAPSGTPGSPTQTAEPGLTRPLIPLTSPQMLEYCPDVAAVHFDVDAEAVEEIYVCIAEDVAEGDTTTPDQIPSVQSVSRVSEGADQLLSAYAEPNAPVGTGPCIELAADPLIVWVKTADRIIPVYAPVDECGFPTDRSTEAYQAIDLELIAEARFDDPAVDPDAG